MRAAGVEGRIQPSQVAKRGHLRSLRVWRGSVYEL